VRTGILAQMSEKPMTMAGLDTIAHHATPRLHLAELAVVD